jgi:hypothetical protein
MSTLSVIYLLTFTYPPPIPDGPYELLGVQTATYSLLTSDYGDQANHSFTRTELDSLSTLKTSLDGKHAYIVKYSRQREPWATLSTPLKTLDSVSFDGSFLFGRTSDTETRRIAVSGQSGQYCVVPNGTLISTNSGVYVLPKSSRGTAYTMNGQNPPRWVPVKRTRDLINRLSVDFGLPELSHSFITAHPELAGGFGHAVYADSAQGAEQNLVYARGKVRYAIGTIQKGTSPYAIMFPSKSQVLVSRYAEKIQDIRMSEGKIMEAVHWVSRGNKFGYSWVMIR